MSKNEPAGEIRPQFRSAMGGYRKEDVNRYISYINSNFRGIEATLKNTINAQKEELASLQGEIDELLHEASEKQETLDRAQAVSKEVESLKQQLDALRAALDEKTLECNTEKEHNLSMRAELDTLRADRERQDGAPAPDDETVQKAAQYDMIVMGIGSFVQSAAEQAKAVVENARREAQKILDDANSSVNRESLETAKRALNDQFRRISETCCEDVVARIGSVRSGLDTLVDDIRTKYNEIDLFIEESTVDMGEERH